MRDSNGRFIKGNPGGPGRKPRATEEQYLTTMQEVVTVADWEAIVKRAVKDAKLGDALARSWLSKHLMPPPKQRVIIEEVDWRDMLREDVASGVYDFATLAELHGDDAARYLFSESGLPIPESENQT